MEETENIWHPEQKVACSNLRNLQFTRIFSEQWLCFFPIIFVALLAEVEKRLATILFSGGLTGTRASAHARGAMYARCLRGFVLGRRRLILVRQSPFVVEGNCEGGREDETKGRWSNWGNTGHGSCMYGLAQSGASGCEKGFVKCFLRVPLACLGSMATAVEPNSLGTLRKMLTKPFTQPDAPRCQIV